MEVTTTIQGWDKDLLKFTPNNMAGTIVAEVLHGYHILFSLDRWGDRGEPDVSASVRKAVVRGK